MTEVPRCAVVRAVDVEGPRGGNIRVLFLACGSRTWNRQKPDKPPPASKACTSCYIERKLAPPASAWRLKPDRAMLRARRKPHPFEEAHDDPAPARVCWNCLLPREAKVHAHRAR